MPSTTNNQTNPLTIAEIGDRIAKKNRWQTLKGKAAVQRFIIDKYHWLPKDVKKLTDAELRMLLDGVPEAKRPKPRKRMRMSDRVRYLD